MRKLILDNILKAIGENKIEEKFLLAKIQLNYGFTQKKAREYLEVLIDAKAIKITNGYIIRL